MTRDAAGQAVTFARRTRWTSAGHIDSQAVSRLLAAAYHDLPIARWLAPEPRERPGILAPYLRIWVDHALEHGHVDTITTNTGHLAAAAVWLPHNPTRPSPPPHDCDNRGTLTFAPTARGFTTSTPRWTPASRTTGSPTPAGTRSAAVAVTPPHLLTVAHDRFDTDGISALHVTTAPAPDGLLRRHGYTPPAPLACCPTRARPLRPRWRDPVASESR